MKTFIITSITNLAPSEAIIVRGMTVDTYEKIVFSTNFSFYNDFLSFMNTATPITLDLEKIF